MTITASGMAVRVLALLAAVDSVSASGTVPVNLYEWIAVAPCVAAAEAREEVGKFAEIRLEEVFRGDLPPGTRVAVDLRRANRDREEGRPALRLEPERRYLVLLRRDASRSRHELPVYDLVRGIDGTREIPAEGSRGLLDAIGLFVRIQDRKDEIAAWKAIREMLDATNPLLLESSLDLFLKFRRGDAALLPALRPILDHPRPDLRARAARLIGQIVKERAGDRPADDGAVLAELYGRARRDPSAEVRIAATSALGGIPGSGPREVLREIARSDPEQAVRYEAEKLLYERDAGSKPKVAR